VVRVSAEVTIQGALEVRTYGRSQKAIRLLSCPFCGHEFDSHEPRWKHFLDQHNPEDAGLSPLNERAPKLVPDGGQDPRPEPTDEKTGQKKGYSFEYAESCEQCGQSNAGVRTEEGRILCGECALQEGV